MSFNWKSWFRRSIVDENLRKFDPYAHAVTVIAEPHRHVHDGFFHHATGRVAALANLADFEILLAVPAGVFPHFRADLFTLGDTPGDLNFYEGTTATDDGTVVPNFNRNRNSSRAAGMVITHTPTLTLDGTLLHTRLVPDVGGPGGNVGGAVSPDLGEEWILKPETNYLIRLTNNSGADIVVTYEIYWYELDYPEDGTAIDQPSQT
jgi:hypothetical protein